MKAIFNLMFCLLVAGTFAGWMPFETTVMAGSMYAANLLLGGNPVVGVANAGLLKEVWLRVFLHNFWAQGGFVNRSVDLSGLVENNQINYARAGAKPVILKNASGDITTVSFSATPKAIDLDWFDSENTEIIFKNAFQYSFSAIDVTLVEHRMSMMERLKHECAWNWTPAANGSDTPVFKTSGAESLFNPGYKALTMADMIQVINVARNRNWPIAGANLVLVLCPNHQSDLLAEDIKAYKTLTDLANGDPKNQFGLVIEGFNNNLVFNKTTGAKQPYGTVFNPTNHTTGSFFYLDSMVARAAGDLDMYWNPKEMNTTRRNDVIGFQQRFTARQMYDICVGSVISTPTS